MSTAFVTQLRTASAPVVVSEGPGALTFRIEASDLWEAVRVVARAETTVSDVKQAVVARLFPNADPADDFVLKLRGWEILDERSPLSDAGIVNGSIVLLAYRRRRPVR